MKNKTIQSVILSIAIGMALTMTSLAHAGGRNGEIGTKFKPATTNQSVDGLKASDTLAKAARDSKRMVRIYLSTGGRGARI
jgi:hypothetical protein